jgi:hypothetical protein
MGLLPAARITDLHDLRTRFDPGSAAAKSDLLAACAACELTNPRRVLRYHEALLFMAAHPQDRGQAAQVEAELARIDAAAPALFLSGAKTEVLEASGLAGEPIEASFSIAIIEWLLARFPGAVELGWQEGTLGTDLDELLTLAVLRTERDGRLNERFDMRRWLRVASGADTDEPGTLRWVLDRLRELLPDPEVRDAVAESLDLRVLWRLDATGPTRTMTRFPARPRFMQRDPLRRTFDIARLLRRPLPDPVSLAPRAARELIDIARGVLAVRRREADPVTYANPREVTLFSLDRGIDIALFGLAPARRLPIESYFGYVAARNRVPIAYGGGWVMDRRAEIGVHLFDSFRGGESAYLFGQVLRTYRQHYRVTRFQVDPYQFGEGNAEAIRSGAFWFYYRFGFRPLDDALRDLAADEWTSIRRDRAYRTSAAILRRFTTAPLVLDFDDEDDDTLDDTLDDKNHESGRSTTYRPDPTRLGAALTETIRTRFGADRAAAQRRGARRLARLLPAGGRTRWSDNEQRAFERLTPLIAALPGLERWSATDRKALAAVMRAKGGPRERDYVLRMQRHPRLRSAFAALDESIDWDALPARP